LLPGRFEQIITAGTTAEAAADRIMRHAGLADATGRVRV
jgi:hypothetical protein